MIRFEVTGGSCPGGPSPRQCSTKRIASCLYNCAASKSSVNDPVDSSISSSNRKSHMAMKLRIRNSLKSAYGHQDDANNAKSAVLSFATFASSGMRLEKCE